MKVDSEHTTIYTIELNETEAFILRALVQNCPKDCSKEVMNFHEELFERLTAELC